MKWLHKRISSSGSILNLKTSGAGTKTTNGNVSVSNNLQVSAGTFDAGANDLVVTGTTTVDGTI